MSKIKNAFQNGKAFIAFLTAGDPSADKTVEYILDMEEAGADLVEIGIPFSDPHCGGRGDTGSEYTGPEGGNDYRRRI